MTLGVTRDDNYVLLKQLELEYGDCVSNTPNWCGPQSCFAREKWHVGKLKHAKVRDKEE